MQNKYFYSLRRDPGFRTACLLSVMGVLFCVFMFRLDQRQGLELKDIRDKQGVILQIPMLKARLAGAGGAAAAVPVNGLVLSGIIYDKEQPMAVINNILFKAGDEVEGRRVTAVRDSGVTVCDIDPPNKCEALFLE